MAAREFVLPDLGEGLEDAEVVAWRVAEGDRVELNQTLVEVNTAKALVEIPAPWEGVVARLHAAEGDVVKVGSVLVSIDVGGAEDASPASSAAPGASAAAEAQQASQEVGEAAAERASEAAAADGERSSDGRPRRRPVLVGYGVEEEDEPPSGSGVRSTATGARERRAGPVPASPPVRRLAKELGVDLAAIDATGAGGRVTREDVERAAATAGSTSAHRPAAPRRPDEVIHVRGVRRLVAEKMTRSAREIPHVTTFLTVDATHVQAFREEIARETGQRVSPLPIVVRALVDVCAAFPKLNSTFDAERSEIRVWGRVHAGIATDTERGLLVTVVRDAQDRGIAAIAGEIARLASAAREGTATTEEVTGSTITISNVGSFGAEYGTPIINHPEAAILAPGVIEARALVVDGRVEARPAMTLSLSFDHRVLDGAEAGRALRALGDVLEGPFKLGALPR